MDPNETLKTILRAFEEGDCVDALEAMANLDDWLDRGGAMPRVTESDDGSFRIE